MFEFDYDRLHDFQYYASKALKIKVEDPPAIIPFIFNSIQLRLDNLFNRLLREKGKVEVIILKARREGLSTYVEARLFHEIVTNKNTAAFIIAHDKDGLNTIFNMSKLFYEELPPALRPMIRYSSKKELVFENPNDKARLLEPGLRSSLEVFSANKVTASRSGGYLAAHFSEVAFYDYAEELLTAIVSSTQNARYVVWESTANGRGNFFHNEWLNAKEGESVYTPIFFSWLEFPSYKEEFSSPAMRVEFINNLDDEECMLRDKFHASPEQLFWRRRIILKFQGDVDKFHQEYPTDDVEAFVASGDSYFKRTKMRELLTKTTPPSFVGEMTVNGPVECEDGELYIWEHPLPGEQYVIGVDACGGTEKGDPAAIEILKVPKGPPIIEQVGEWSGRIDPVTLGKLAVLIAQYYNEGMISPEINNHGLTTLNEIKENYWHIYQWQYFDRFGTFYSKKLGWETNISTRPMLCDYTAACVMGDVLVLRSEELVDEMMTFIRRDSGRGGEAEYGQHDDKLFAFMIALFTLAHSFQSTSLLKELGSFGKRNLEFREEPNPDFTTSVSNRACIDTDYLPQSERSIYGGGKDGWLNY